MYLKILGLPVVNSVLLTYSEGTPPPPRKLSRSPGALGMGLRIQEDFLQEAAFHLDLSLLVGEEDVLF